MLFPEESEFICVLGWNSALYEKALQWVDGTRRVAIVSEEEQKSVDRRVKIYELQSSLQIEQLAKRIAWSAVFKKLTIVGSGPLKEEIEKHHLAAHLILSEAADWWVKALKNGRANQKPYRRGMDLKGAFEGIPAIILGAGPSLEKNRHLLPAFADRALLFAAGSALNAIEVEPHFAGSIDAEAPYPQFKRHSFSETPFCYQSRMNPDNFSLIHGERLLFPDSSSQALNWLYDQEPFDSGWTVGNFLTAVAAHLGCDPLILVGMDFCYAHNRKYADVETALPDGLIQRGEFLTQRDWLMAAEWTEARPERMINATEGGMLRLPEERLENLLERYPKRGDLYQRVQETIQKLPLVEARRWKEWEGEIVTEKLLEPLWQIWRPIFEREVEVDPHQNLELHKQLFFEQVLREHG